MTVNKKIVLGFISLIAALAIAFIVIPMSGNIANKVTEVVFIKDDLPKGTALTNEHIYKKAVSLQNLPKDVLKKDLKTGMVLDRDMHKGDLIRESDLSSGKGQTVENKPYSLNTLDGKYGAVSLGFKKTSDALKNGIKTGDVISIIALNGDGGSFIPPSLKYVFVLSNAVVKDDNASENMDITVLATEKQAQEIANAEEKGLKAFLVYRGGFLNAKKFLEKEEEFLKKNA